MVKSDPEHIPARRRGVTIFVIVEMLKPTAQDCQSLRRAGKVAAARCVIGGETRREKSSKEPVTGQIDYT